MGIITNYFTRRFTSGWVEGLNNKIKALKRRCYGIANPISLFRRIWLDLKRVRSFCALIAQDIEGLHGNSQRTAFFSPSR
jgi:hypothetical protein